MAATQGAGCRFGTRTIHCGNCGDVGVDSGRPHAECEKDVRCHVLGVTRVRGDLRVAQRCAQPERRVIRIVVTMDEIMEQAGVLTMIHPRLLEHGRCAHVARDVAPAVRVAENRQPVEGSRVDVARVAIVELRHCSLVAEVARLLAAISVEDFNRIQVRLFALGLCLGPTFRRARRQLAQRHARGRQVLLHPDGMVISHRLAPVSHGEARIHGLGAAKRGRSRLVLEVVEQGQAVEEIGLRRDSAGIGELDVAVSIGSGGGRCSEQQACCERGPGFAHG